MHPYYESKVLHNTQVDPCHSIGGLQVTRHSLIKCYVRHKPCILVLFTKHFHPIAFFGRLIRRSQVQIPFQSLLLCSPQNLITQSVFLVVRYLNIVFYTGHSICFLVSTQTDLLLKVRHIVERIKTCKKKIFHYFFLFFNCFCWYN